MVFAVDARLRPRGAEGELAVTPAHLESYFAAEAQPWEALTYTKLRLIAGNAELGRQSSHISESLFKRFAVDPGFPQAVREMRAKLQNATAPAKSIRTSAGGLYDIDFLSSFLLVKNDIRPKTGSLRDRLWRCSAKRRVGETRCRAARSCRRTLPHRRARTASGDRQKWPLAALRRTPPQCRRKTCLANSPPRISRRPGARVAAHVRRSAKYL